MIETAATIRVRYKETDQMGYGTVKDYIDKYAYIW